MTHETTTLSWDVHVAPAEPLSADDLAPGQNARFWSPISATLISGERDAVLVDALLTVGQAHDLVEWIEGTERTSRPCTSRTVTGIIGSGWARSSIAFRCSSVRSPSGHRANAGWVRAGVPRVVLEATLRRQASASTRIPGASRRPHDRPRGPRARRGRARPHRHRPDELPGRPEIGLVVAGDAANNDVHLYLAESDPENGATGSPRSTRSSPCTRDR